MTGPDQSLPLGKGVLRLLATTDLHSNLLSYDYYADRPDPSIGLSRVASLIAEARQEVREAGGTVLLLDNGDGLQGAPIGEISSDDPIVPHPLMQAFDVLQYDAIGLGNHDFNFGLETLEQVLEQAPCPVICSNMTAVEEGRELPFARTTILEREVPACAGAPPLRIGILSVLPPQTVTWDAHLLEGQVVVADMVQAAAAAASALRREGCDIVIALAHTGVGGLERVPGMENALLPIAATAGIDAVIGGHTHKTLPDPEHSFIKPVVMPGAHGSHLGQIDLQVSHGPKGWRLENWDARLKPICSRAENGDLMSLVEEDAELTRALGPAHDSTRERMRQPVGFSDVPLHSFFTFFGPDLGLELAAAAQAAAVRPLLEGTEVGKLPLLSAAAPGKFGGRSGPGHYTDIGRGDLCMRNVADLHIFPNELRLVVATGAQVLDWLEMSAGVFKQVRPGSTEQELVDPSRAGHNFDVLFGLQYEIDLSAPPRFSSSGVRINPAAGRIRRLRVHGRPVAPAQRFAVVVNSYRVSGGGNFQMVKDAESIPLPPVRIRDVIRDYVAGRLPEDPLAQEEYPWRFAELNNAEAAAYTSPEAVQYLDELPEGQVRNCGMTPKGFLKLMLAL
ncbi:5'-nucleotidase C-terminal domain-containing protein [Phaeobacter gallaeciensis]|uniref:5'-nucleotidase C-terminal domain-containing protein n=1 Tax=Phaeobacter gallaeciensis TaxID=60890 RepID=UPI00237EFD94|nr:5'-nucleotidase C-terminal domain-containing protein [Phaeobacter gallaeciensis]MDE4303873.1 5'-nucleotidase C-terminal domain-containing protein [Phaeobacter gallaeciensis]MDE4308932.1 5'-nucleotidase C-terminal domain-containing protein [Phaeobacter gallaeciensis]MDE4313514.1 5'-nucleotidase C-terminal domain-containing protein [Phaeobacter gallaeciensis]MDE4317861.1 5'-nucleotidase C-terminal domain-containing protein [Phaeobacter gallaeciensis]MDE4322324.1 5'-nucleotidase C-terminal dom